MRSSAPFSPGDPVVAYLRDSGHDDQELSVAQQEAAIRAWCADHGLILTRVFTDAAAPGSSTIGRAEFRAMISHFHAPDCADRGVIIWKFNRFARDIDDAQFFKADLRRRGFIVHSLHDSVPDGLDGRFFEAAIDWMNARYLEDLSADIKRGLHHLVDQYGGMPGNPPKGFKRQIFELGRHRDGQLRQAARWVPDPDMIDTIRLAWKMRAGGLGYGSIHQATRLYTTRQSYANFFRNRIYIGELEYGGRLITGYCEPIIDRDTWEVVQTVMDANRSSYLHLRQNHPRRARSNFLLSGLVQCAICKTQMYGNVVMPRGQRYGYYDCANRRNGGCPDAKPIPQVVLEDAVIDNLVNHILQTDNLTQLLNTYRQDTDDLRRSTQQQIDALNRQLGKVRRQLGNLADLLAEDGLRSRALMDKVRTLEAKESELVLQIGELAVPVQPVELKPIDEIMPTVEEIKTRLLTPERNADTKNILAGLIDHIEVRREGKNQLVGVIYYYLPPADKDILTSKCQTPGRGVIYTHKFSYTY